MTFKDFYRNNEDTINTLQAALDVAGTVPEIGAPADIANTLISTLRAAAADTADERKKHILNAGISAIATIPFASLINLLKLRKVKPVAKAAVAGARELKTYGKAAQAAGRFDEKSIDEPRHPGILKRQVKGKLTCSKARRLEGKGGLTAKAARRYQNYHCQ